MTAIILPILAAFLIAALGAAGQRLREWVLKHRRLGHLYVLCGRADRVQVVIPGFPVARFRIANATAEIPPNVPVMPMAEGGAIAQLIRGLNEIGQRDVELVSSANFRDDSDVTISIGGPSVNEISGKLLADGFPSFTLQYPQHVASYGTTTFLPERLDDESLREDYGFIAVGRTDNHHRFVVLCGVWAPGTQIATTALLELDRRSEVASLLRGGHNFFAVAHGKITGLEMTGVRVIEVRDADL